MVKADDLNWADYMDPRTFMKQAGDLAAKIKLEEPSYSPDLIVGVTMGAHDELSLHISHLMHLDYNHNTYLTVCKERGTRRIDTEYTRSKDLDKIEDLVNKDVLLVDSRLVTGGSIAAAKKYLESKGATVKTAALHIMPDSKFTPDFYLKETLEIEKFQWEYIIDMFPEDFKDAY